MTVTAQQLLCSNNTRNAQILALGNLTAQIPTGKLSRPGGRRSPGQPVRNFLRLRPCANPWISIDGLDCLLPPGLASILPSVVTILNSLLLLLVCVCWPQNETHYSIIAS